MRQKKVHKIVLDGFVLGVRRTTRDYAGAIVTTVTRRMGTGTTKHGMRVHDELQGPEILRWVKKVEAERTTDKGDNRLQKHIEKMKERGRHREVRFVKAS